MVFNRFSQTPESQIHSIFSIHDKCTRMQLFDLKQFLSGYPILSNTNELIQADILLMPAVRDRFINDQFLIDWSISEKYQVISSIILIAKRHCLVY